MKIDNSSTERVEEFKYLGMMLPNQNSIQDEIKSRLKLGNACYYTVQNLLSSRLLSKNLKINIYRTTILPVVVYGCETWSLTWRKECRLRVFEELRDLYSLPHILQVVKSRRMRWAGHVARMGEEVCTGFWWGS